MEGPLLCVGKFMYGDFADKKILHSISELSVQRFHFLFYISKCTVSIYKFIKKFQ